MEGIVQHDVKVVKLTRLHDKIQFTWQPDPDDPYSLYRAIKYRGLTQTLPAMVSAPAHTGQMTALSALAYIQKLQALAAVASRLDELIVNHEDLDRPYHVYLDGEGLPGIELAEGVGDDS